MSSQISLKMCHCTYHINNNLQYLWFSSIAMFLVFLRANELPCRDQKYSRTFPSYLSFGFDCFFKLFRLWMMLNYICRKQYFFIFHLFIFCRFKKTLILIFQRLKILYIIIIKEQFLQCCHGEYIERFDVSKRFWGDKLRKIKLR